MNSQPTHLVDDSAAKLAALDVSPVDDRFEGTIALDRLPSDLRKLFDEFEDVVEGQMFSLLDGIEDRIRAAGLRVLYENGGSSSVADLQVYPTTGAVSFKAGRPAADSVNGNPAGRASIVRPT